jgi:hypothetical protein
VTVTLDGENAISELPENIFLHDSQQPGVFHRSRVRHVGYEEPLEEHTGSDSDRGESEEPDEEAIARYVTTMASSKQKQPC